VNVKAVLMHLNRSMRSGDYLVVEDTGYIRGKHETLREFARAHPGQFQVDTRFTDLFGYNGTFNFNGYLRKR
jgi:cephalosporin hydroxylase